MSRSKIILLLVVFVCLSQALTAWWLSWLPAYLHVFDGLLRPLLMTGMAAGLLVLLLRRGKSLPRSECLALLIGIAGGLANLTDILRLGGVVDFIPLASDALASPGDFLIAGGFLSLLPLSLRHARQGGGLYGLYTHWRHQARVRWLERLEP